MIYWTLMLFLNTYPCNSFTLGGQRSTTCLRGLLQRSISQCLPKAELWLSMKLGHMVGTHDFTSYNKKYRITKCVHSYIILLYLNNVLINVYLY